jgi:hypothetical protein
MGASQRWHIVAVGGLKAEHALQTAKERLSKSDSPQLTVRRGICCCQRLLIHGNVP